MNDNDPVALKKSTFTLILSEMIREINMTSGNAETFLDLRVEL